MFFKFFTLSANTEKDIINAGFSVNSFEDYNVYNGAEIEFVARSPKDYLFNGNVWKKIDSSDIYERSCMLAKTPYLSFDELWDLALQSDHEEAQMGALVFMIKQHYQELRQKQKALIEASDNISKAEKRISRLLSRLL